MWQRSDLKARAKQNMNRCYWKAVLVALVLGIVGGGANIASNSRYTVESDSWSNGQFFLSPAVIIGFLGGMLTIVIIGLAVDIFLFSPIEIGCYRFFLLSRVQETEFNEMGFAFSNGYKNVVKIQFLRGLYTWLWSLLFVIPGIIKAYEYRMIPYLLAENPELDSSEAFRISREMMDGQKMDTFVLDLSFLGWIIVSSFTCGILAIFYVAPYIAYTNAELYIALQCNRYNRYNSGGYTNVENPYGKSSPYVDSNMMK